MPLLRVHLSRQHLDRDFGTTGQFRVCGQEQSAAVFDGSGEMQGIGKFERIRGSESGRSFADGFGQGQHVDVRVAEEGPIARLQTGIAVLEGCHQSFGSGEIADSQFVPGRTKCGEPSNHFRPPERIVFQEIDDAVRVEIDPHGSGASGTVRRQSS